MVSPSPAWELPGGSSWVTPQSKDEGAAPGALQPGWSSLATSQMFSSRAWLVAVTLGLRLEHVPLWQKVPLNRFGLEGRRFRTEVS